MYEKYGYLIDTHTAVAYKVYEDYRNATGDETPTVIASTASAYKFAVSVAEALNMPKEPDGFAYVRTLCEKTKVKNSFRPEGPRQKEIRHDSVIDRTALAKAVKDSLGL